MTTQPKWSTSNRKAYLVKLFLDGGGFCIYGHKNCLIPAHHYELYIETVIDYWKAEDREQAKLDWEEESKAMHSLGERRLPLTGRFNNISQDIFHANQPLYYLESLGMSGLKLQPFAKVKLASSYLRLHIDLGDSLRGTSKNKRRKAIRYGKPLPQEVEARVSKLVSLAVRDYLNH
jgi:hypothetical protein